MKREPLLLGPHPAEVHHALHELGQAHVVRGELHLAGLNAGQIEHVVDKREQVLIMDRTGHKSSAQIQAYRREVALAVARKLPLLRPLNEAIPELAISKGGVRPKGPGKAPPSRGAQSGKQRYPIHQRVTR